MNKEIISASSDTVLMSLVFDEDYKYFDGHFDDFKLLPALIQIHLVTGFCHDFFKLSLSPKSIPNLKFVKPITPNKKVFLEIKYHALNKKVDFIFKDEKEIHSQGTIKYE